MPWRKQQVPTRALLKVFLGAGLAVILIVGSLLGSIQLYHQSIISQQEAKSLYEILNRQIILNKEAGILAQRLETELKEGGTYPIEMRHELLILSTEMRQENARLQRWMDSTRARRTRELHQTVSSSSLTPRLKQLQKFTLQLARVNDLRAEEALESISYLTQDAQESLTDLLNFLATKVDHEYRVASEVLMVRTYWIGIPVLFILLVTWLLIFRPMYGALKGRNDRLNEEVLRAETASRSKIEFLANVSHEIRTPMTAILGYLDLVQQDPSVSSQSRSRLDIMDRNARHLLRLIDEILDVSKADAGKLQLHRAEAQLDDILFDIYSLLKIKADERGIDLMIEYDGPVPKVIYTDPVRLKQVLFNIVGNAVKFTSKGYVKVLVSMDPKLRNSVRFDVIDTGVGIPRAHFSKLFKPFEQVDASSSRISTGTGLGLVLSKMLTEKLGGSLALESSKPGVGTTFRITLDGGAVAGQSTSVRNFNGLTPAESSPTSPSPASSGHHLAGKKFLIVDDVQENGFLFQVYLEQAGALPHVATSGPEALKMVRENHYDLILLDLQMPGMDGFTTLERLRAAGFGNAIFALTAHAMNEEKERALRSGFNGFITKPIRAKAFLQIMEDHFRGQERAEYADRRYSFN